MNKGLEIRKAKLEKKAKKRYEVKADQVGVERKVEITYIELKRINGKYERFNLTGKKSPTSIGGAMNCLIYNFMIY